MVASGIACICLLLATPVNGQGNYQPNRQLGFSADQSNQIIDHSSMSPVSWSAPSVSNAIPFSAPSNTVLPPSVPANSPASTFQPPRDTAAAVSPDSATNYARELAKLVNGSAVAKSSTPSIPDLGAATPQQSSQQFNSLIRQPETAAPEPATSRQSTYRLAKFGGGKQAGLPLNAPSSPNAASLRNAPSTAAETDIPGAYFDGLPAASSTVTPATPPPVVSTPDTTPSGRHPLSVTSSLPSEPPANQQPATPTPPATNGFLVSQPATVQSVEPSYPSVGPADVLFAGPVQSQQTLGGLPNFRPDLGHRSPNPTFRGRDHDSGQKLDFEDKKKEYPGIGEILATGRYFGSVSGLFLQPAFHQNSAITQFNSSAASATFASSEAFDFDYETAPRLRLGFESRFGPGVELDYWQFDEGSNVSTFTSNGRNSAQLSSGLFGPSSLTTLEAVNAGETLSAVHSIDIETFSAMFFKEIKFPISRLNGMFGFQYASIFQELDAELTDAGGSVIGSVRSTSDLRAYGPKFKFEYYRPVGHTKLEFVTAFGGSLLFGERDQIVTNDQTPAVNRFGADEFVITGDFYGGVQWKKLTAENRGYYVRLGVTHQSWIGGGSAVSGQDNFGLRGFAFEVGVNR